jgi:hypothetical protein
MAWRLAVGEFPGLFFFVGDSGAASSVGQRREKQILRELQPSG